jgi:ribonuclease VapC
LCRKLKGQASKSRYPALRRKRLTKVIVDTSAVLAILFQPDAERCARAISNAPVCRMSVATFVEISMVMESQTGDRGSRQWDQFFRRAGFALEPVTEEQAYAARQTWSDFG